MHSIGQSHLGSVLFDTEDKMGRIAPHLIRRTNIRTSHFRLIKGISRYFLCGSCVPLTRGDVYPVWYHKIVLLALGYPFWIIIGVFYQ